MLATADDTLRAHTRLVHGLALWEVGRHADAIAELRALRCEPGTTVAQSVCHRIDDWLDHHHE